jgi:hypothetical protein
MAIEQDAKQVVKDVAALPEAAVISVETKATTKLSALVAKHPNITVLVVLALGAGIGYEIVKHLP